MYQKTWRNVWATGTWNRVSLEGKKVRGIRRDVKKERRRMYQNIGWNVTSGLGNRHVEWGQRREDEDERKTKRYEGEGEKEKEGGGEGVEGGGGCTRKPGGTSHPVWATGTQHRVRVWRRRKNERNK